MQRPYPLILQNRQAAPRGAALGAKGEHAAAEVASRAPLRKGGAFLYRRSPVTTKSASPSTALGTSQQPRLIDNRHSRAVLGNQRGKVGLGSVIAALAPHDQPHLGRDRLAQGHRRRLAFIAA
jgi:hypothetical protein